MSDEQVKIERADLYTPAVEDALSRERMGRARAVQPPPVSPLRRLLNDSMLYLPIAAMLGALSTWLLLEPRIMDMVHAAGEVVMVNEEPMGAGAGVVSITVGSREVLVVPASFHFEKGTNGQAAFGSLAEVRPGTFIEATGIEVKGGARMLAMALRPTTEKDAARVMARVAASSKFFLGLLLPLCATLIGLGLLLAEGISTRNWVRMIQRSVIGSLLALLMSVLAFLPAGVMLTIGQWALAGGEGANGFLTMGNIEPWRFLVYAACRSCAWAFLGAAMGLGMNLVRSTRQQAKNAVFGGALGGTLGGLFFDPIDRFLRASIFDDADISRLVGLLAVGLSIGLFTALVERLAREAWLRVRTGPLVGKAFVLYKTPTVLGSSPSCDVYLFKDAEIDPSHAQIHRVGTTFEIEDLGSRTGTQVSGEAVRRRRLQSGDQIVLGGTILEFEERARRHHTP